MSTEDAIRQYILTELSAQKSEEELTDDFPLLEARVLDSVGIFHLVGFLESEFGLSFEVEELLPDNFQTIGHIAQLVASKQG